MSVNKIRLGDLMAGKYYTKEEKLFICNQLLKQYLGSFRTAISRL